MDEKRIAEIREAQKQAENIINTLHTERLDYHSEYVPLIESNHDIPWLLDLLEQAQKEIERLKDINSALENDLINANMNLERLTERVEAQRWIPVSERLPESGEEVIACYWDAYDEDDGFPTCVICTYYKAGDILENEMPYKERLAVSMGKATGIEQLFSLLFETRNVPAERDGFYFCDVNSEGLMEWRRHSDIITHWRRLPTRKEVEGVKK